ncbi:NAD(P)/FAD-dependent oxidoreductase [Limoniibacter endophyticus]|uniref:NADH:ubiquinone reductase (non-electrogenic) n=1 Tax=Limoniibacter endophyticus TaxID=1565040 RepID=A0A8J3DKJ0_9HYPH|nr:NAD(P)/FAD-dependent oxidoreductase [Limoniibacter endophyticus]GHC60971.1 NADH dehydrogenase [Limoniibacter endophyticus]
MAEHHVVVIGGGFGGLEAVNGLKNANVRITLIDRRNHHLFQPLLYQVAVTTLATSEIAWPIRTLYRDQPHVRTILAEVVGVDPNDKIVRLDNGQTMDYDTLIIATGSTHAYFGKDEWAHVAPGLKTLEDATMIRRRILRAFEAAELEQDTDKRRALLTFAIIGAGPTGVEMAGIIAELAHKTLHGEFRSFDPAEARIILIEGGPRVLSAFTPELSEYTRNSLEKLGVEVRTDSIVSGCSEEGVSIGEEFIAARTIVWAAGVQASPAAKWLGVEADRAGRAIVDENLRPAGLSDVYVIGDTAAVASNGKPVPGIAPAAKQMGAYVARRIRSKLAGTELPGRFNYRHQGNLATIGTRSAVVDFGKIKLRGALAWWLWGIAHIYFLIGTRSRMSVAWSWLWIYLTGQRSARLITQKEAAPPPAPPST